MSVVYLIGLVCLLSHCGQCELTWDKVLSARLDDIVFHMKSKDNSITTQVQDLMSMVTATNHKLASFEKRLSEVADCSVKLVAVEERLANIGTHVKEVAVAEVGRRTHLLRRGLEKLASFEKRLSEVADCSVKLVAVEDRLANIDTHVKEVAVAEVGRRTHLLRRGLEKEKAATMTRFESLRKNQEKLLSRNDDIERFQGAIVTRADDTDTRLNETRVQISNLEHDVIVSAYNTSTFFTKVKTLENTQSAMKGTEGETRALISVIEEEVKSTQRIFHTLQSQVQTLVETQADTMRRIQLMAPKDCSELLSSDAPKRSGVYTITTPFTQTKIQVHCDMETDGGGWTVFQKRFNGREDFYRNFSDYENGFGSVYAEYWLGLKYIYELTSLGSYQLRVDIARSNGSKGYDVYGGFSLQSRTNYTLNVGSRLRSNGVLTENSFHSSRDSTPVGNAFSTYDHDVDRWSGGNCAADLKGGWWYNACKRYINLNALYLPGQGHWEAMTYDSAYGLATSTMMFKSVS